MRVGGLRSSRHSGRLQGLEPSNSSSAEIDPAVTGTSMPYLPPEILGIIARYLSKSDLKSLRLASKQCCFAATPGLFDRIFVSPRIKDLNVFIKISNRAPLARSIKILIYDLMEFQKMSKREYFEEVCRKVKMGYFGLSGDTVARALRWLGLNSLSADLDKEIPEDDLFAKYLNAAWFKQNYSKWDSLRVEEHHILVKRLCDVLSLGLPRFQKLESIKFDDYLAWFSAESANAEFIQESGTHPELFPRGSPLSRTWKMFYPRPSKVKDRSNHVKNVMRALSKPNCFIKCLGLSARVDTGLPPNFFRHCRINKGSATRWHHRFGSLNR